MNAGHVKRIDFWGTWALGLTLMVLAGCPSDATDSRQAGPEKRPSTTRLELTSPAFAEGQPIPIQYTADGDDVSPPLSWSGVPEGTKELTLICDDPDAPDPARPRPDPWVHWVVYKIPPEAKGLPEGIAKEPKPKEPAGIVQGNNSWPAIGYGGPDPPIGKHRYVFKLYALDTELSDAPGRDKASLLAAIEGHVLAEGELLGTYAR